MTERWSTAEIGPDIVLIQTGDIVIGSIVHMPPKWHVEVIWSGPGGDIKGQFEEYTSALAFVEGVEKTIKAIGVQNPWLAAVLP